MSHLFQKYSSQIAMYQQGQSRIPVHVGSKTVSDENSTFVIAEAANNHMCDLTNAKTMIDLAVAAGADAIKFQTYKAERLVRNEASSYWQGTNISQLDYYKRLDKFGEAEYQELFRYADENEIVCFSTPFDVDSARMLDQLGAKLFKIASCDILDLRLLRTIASFGKPIVLSTGGATIDEIEQAIDTIYGEGNFQLIILACMLSYPTPDKDANLRKIAFLKDHLHWMQVGLSDHTEPDDSMVIPSVAVALGASMIEKHYTLDRSWTGSGHAFSVSPSDLSQMIKNIRLTETVLGAREFTVHDVEQAARNSARRSLVAGRALQQGTVITTEMIEVKRPGDGLPPDQIDSLIGRVLTRNVEADHAFSLADFEE